MIASMKEHKGPVYAISIKADDSECVSASADGSCITWSLTDMHPFVRINALFAANFFKSVVYHPDESQVWNARITNIPAPVATCFST